VEKSLSSFGNSIQRALADRNNLGNIEKILNESSLKSEIIGIAKQGLEDYKNLDADRIGFDKSFYTDSNNLFENMLYSFGEILKQRLDDSKEILYETERKKRVEEISSEIKMAEKLVHDCETRIRKTMPRKKFQMTSHQKEYHEAKKYLDSKIKERTDYSGNIENTKKVLHNNPIKFPVRINHVNSNEADFLNVTLPILIDDEDENNKYIKELLEKKITIAVGNKNVVYNTEKGGIMEMKVNAENINQLENAIMRETEALGIGIEPKLYYTEEIIVYEKPENKKIEYKSDKTAKEPAVKTRKGTRVQNIICLNSARKLLKYESNLSVLKRAEAGDLEITERNGKTYITKYSINKFVETHNYIERDKRKWVLKSGINRYNPKK
jgi:hypothetical protein